MARVRGNVHENLNLSWRRVVLYTENKEMKSKIFHSSIWKLYNLLFARTIPNISTNLWTLINVFLMEKFGKFQLRDGVIISQFLKGEKFLKHKLTNLLRILEWILKKHQKIYKQFNQTYYDDIGLKKCWYLLKNKNKRRKNNKKRY